MGDIKTAEIEFINGRFSARNIDDLDIDSKNSTIEMAAAKKMVLRSANDEYELEDAGDIRGRKNYGNFRITKLNGSLDIEGANADLKVRNVASTVSFIKIDDKYADIRIPLKNTKNFSVDFTGAYSAVYGNFEKKAAFDLKVPTMSGHLALPANVTTTSMGSLSNLTVTGVITNRNGSAVVRDTAQKTSITSLGTLSAVTVTGYVTPVNEYGSNNITAVTIPGAIAGGSGITGVSGTISGGTFRGVLTSTNSNYLGNDTPAKFTAVVGDGKLLKIDMKCQNCTVNFK